MKIIPIILVFLSSPALALSPAECDDAREKNSKLLHAIQDHECAGIPKPKRAVAVGDSGDARGWLQIHREYYADAKAESPWLPSYAAVCADERLSECCVVSYWAKYASKAKTDEEKCRVHNGGPTWSQRKRSISNTAIYWAAVRASLRAK